jgi:pteridine reductase
VPDLDGKVVLVTGGARRVGAAIVRAFHRVGARVVVHYRDAADEADALHAELEGARPGSAHLVRADLLDRDAPGAVAAAATARWGRLDAVVNNASLFYPTRVEAATAAQWDELIGINLRAPFFVAQAAAPALRAARGAIVNLADIYAERPLQGFPIYSIAKAGLVMATKTLARELAPEVRVNAVAPGPILWPEQGTSDESQRRIVDRTALRRQGEPADVAAAVLFLVRDAPYVTGQVLAVDGGRSLSP